MQLIYLSPLPWTSFAQRPHKFVEWFHARAGRRVLWVDPYPTRLPIPSDFRRIGVREVHTGATPPPWLEVVQVRGMPIEPIPGFGRMNAWLWISLLQRLERFAASSETLVAIGKPSLLALRVLDRLPRSPALYDAMDNFPAFYKGVSHASMRRREQQLVRRASIMWASSTALKDRWSAIRRDIRLVPNGLDPKALPDFDATGSGQGGKVLGYVGTMASWVDWSWLIALARARPNDLVRLIGPVLVPPPMRLPSNIEILPPCGHREALRAMQSFDVGLIPFLRNELTDCVDPIKFYEYRALGLPVLSTRFGEMAMRDGDEATFLTSGHDDLGEKVSKALQYVAKVESVERFRAAHSWMARFDAAGIAANPSNHD